MSEISDCTEVVEDENKSILMGIIAQLTKGMDLHRVTLPTFVLEPRSMLERITDFMSHPELILDVHKKNDPIERFVDAVRYYLSGWHIKPKGVKKPYNPVLGEHFRCRYQYPNKTTAYYVAEQVSHHPPISAYYYSSPENQLIIWGDLRPKSKFLGNSAATLMQGSHHLMFTNHNERYDFVMPNVYARGVLFGTMTLELGDSSTVRCEKNDLICELEFKTKGFFSGQYNSVFGKIKRESTGEVLYEISGRWSSEMYIKIYKAQKLDIFFDVRSSTIHPKIVAPESDQEEMESRRLWSKVTKGLTSNPRNLDYATDEKSKIEDRQREETKIREGEDVEWTPRFFDFVNNDYRFKLFNLSFADPQAAQKQLENFIFSHHKTGFPNARRQSKAQS